MATAVNNTMMCMCMGYFRKRKQTEVFYACISDV